jgi:Holliday junction DNA helicase RuvA
VIGRIRGTLAAKMADAVAVDVAGVGYEVAMTPRGIATLPGPGSEIVVHTHLHVREDQMALFGFTEQQERDLFRLLLGASGVGPKLALAILATLPPRDLQQAVVSEDAAALTAVPGIGLRTAQKLILDLRVRLDLPDGEVAPSSALAEVREALEGLGYQSAEIREALRGVDGDDESVEVVLKAALQRLGGGS